MRPEDLSKAIRETRDETMSRRRGVIGLSLAAAGSMGLITLYQSGVIRHIPEPPLPALDADKVDASAEAFERFEVAAATFTTAPLVVDEARRALTTLLPSSGRPLPRHVTAPA